MLAVFSLLCKSSAEVAGRHSAERLVDVTASEADEEHAEVVCGTDARIARSRLEHEPDLDAAPISDRGVVRSSARVHVDRNHELTVGQIVPGERQGVVVLRSDKLLQEKLQALHAVAERSTSALAQHLAASNVRGRRRRRQETSPGRAVVVELERVGEQ